MSRRKRGRVVPAVRGARRAACVAAALAVLLLAGFALGDADARFFGGTHHGYDQAALRSASRCLGGTHDGYALAELTGSIPLRGTVIIVM
jgi:hypothetical protein